MQGGGPRRGRLAFAKAVVAEGQTLRSPTLPSLRAWSGSVAELRFLRTRGGGVPYSFGEQGGVIKKREE